MKPRGAKSCLSLADSRLRRRVREPITGTSRRKWGKGSWEDTSEYPGDRVLLLLLIKVTSLVCHLPPSINPPVKTHSLIHIQIMLKHRLRLWQWDWNPVSLFTWRRGQISLCVVPPPSPNESQNQRCRWNYSNPAWWQWGAGMRWNERGRAFDKHFFGDVMESLSLLQPPNKNHPSGRPLENSSGDLCRTQSAIHFLHFTPNRCAVTVSPQISGNKPSAQVRQRESKL